MKGTPISSTANPAPDSAPASAPLKTVLTISGMTCNNCARQVREAIQSSGAVASAAVQLEFGTATVRWKAASDVPAVIHAITDAGFEATELSSADQPANAAKTATASDSWRFAVFVGSACTVPMMVCDWVLDAGMEPWFGWLSFVLASTVQIFSGGRFYTGAWRQIKKGASNMDTLVSLGSGAAFSYSGWLLFSGGHGHSYFMESAAIITLISLGHWMEGLTSVKAEGSLKALMQLAPANACKRNADGSQTIVPVGQLKRDDHILLKPGDRVPVDALVLEGASTLDESMLTGESMPVEKSTGSTLFAGTMNRDGSVVARVTSTGEATALAQIIQAVTRAQNSRADIQRLGDHVSSVFVPIVVAIAILTGLWWGFAGEQAQNLVTRLTPFLWHAPVVQGALASAIVHAVAVLIIACPCAMGLATPIAIMAGTNAAARRGFLIRDGIALERAGRITAIVFDKTGTLTKGAPSVGGVFTVEQRSGNIASSIARKSGHPLSLAIARLHDSATDIPLTEWREIRGCGVQARLGGQLLRLGSLTWLAENRVILSSGEEFATHWAAQGATVLGLACENKLMGLFALNDELKPGAELVIAQLQHSGFKVFLASGDNAGAATAVAKSVGLPSANVFSGVLPGKKSELITQLHEQGELVAFVGDGINDAPALESADLGIAVSRASDVAREAADIILLRSDLEAVPEAIALSQATMRTIRQNLFWAFFYNCLGIPLAAAGFMSPILCALSMGASDLVVIGNALRLLRWKRRR